MVWYCSVILNYLEFFVVDFFTVQRGLDGLIIFWITFLTDVTDYCWRRRHGPSFSSTAIYRAIWRFAAAHAVIIVATRGELILDSSSSPIFCDQSDAGI